MQNLVQAKWILENINSARLRLRISCDYKNKLIWAQVCLINIIIIIDKYNKPI